ncbi:MAG: acyl-CoA thioesterase [Bacteroidota bacterium]
MLTKFENKIKIRVRYGETDQMGYCYYGNYAQYFEVGRVEALRSTGMSYRDMENRGIMLPVAEFSVKYKAPALYDDELTISTRIREVKGPRIVFDYEIHKENGQLVATAETTLVFVSRENMRPIAAPEDFLELMKAYAI